MIPNAAVQLRVRLKVSQCVLGLRLTPVVNSVANRHVPFTCTICRFVKCFVKLKFIQVVISIIVSHDIKRAQNVFVHLRVLTLSKDFEVTV